MLLLFSLSLENKEERTKQRNGECKGRSNEKNLFWYILSLFLPQVKKWSDAFASKLVNKICLHMYILKKKKKDGKDGDSKIVC